MKSGNIRDTLWPYFLKYGAHQGISPHGMLDKEKCTWEAEKHIRFINSCDTGNRHNASKYWSVIGQVVEEIEQRR